MRIACLAASAVPSRAANSIRVMKVCQALGDLGHDVRLWVPGVPSSASRSDLARHYGLRSEVDTEWVSNWPPLRRWDFSLKAVARSIRWGPDAWYVWPYQAAAVLSQLGKPTLLEVHDRPAGNAGPRLFRMFLRGRGARRLLVITEALRARLSEDYGVDLRPPFAVLTPSGVDLEPYEALPSPREARARLGWPERFTAGYTGHLYEGRGLNLIAELARRNPEIAFVWAGGEPDAVERWRSRLAGEGLGNVRLLGFVPQGELPLIAAACEALLMPYERSIAVSSGGNTAAYASPMKAFEYMATGRVILASDLPVLREVLNSDLAVLLEPGSVDSWEAAVRRVRDEPGWGSALAERARREAVKYTWRERTRRALVGLETVAEGHER